MSRNRYKKSPKVAPSQPSHSQAPETSPATQMISQRIAAGGVDYLEENFIRIMIGSEQLAEEPEFKDLTMDGDKAMRVTERWMRKFEKRLAAAEKKGEDEYQQVFDEMRIEMIAELVTPAFRKDVERRLQALVDRLQTGDDLEKLEMVILLKAMLSTKRMPWGICCLILAIYQRSIQPILQGSEQEQEIYNAIEEALKANEGDDVDLLALLEDPEKLDQVAQKVFGAQPDLRQRAEEQIWKMVDDFETKLGHGDIELNLFSERELAHWEMA